MRGVRAAGAVFYKQSKDTIKNIQVLVLFFVFPIIANVMTRAIPADFQTPQFLSIFAAMHAVFTPMVATAAAISEEKEKNTLRSLILSNVSAGQYLAGVGSFLFLCTMVSGLLFLPAAGQPDGGVYIRLMGAMAVGSSLSILIGMAVGGLADNMMSANGMAVPLGMIFAFLPMLGTLNEKIGGAARFTYGMWLSAWIGGELVSLKGVVTVGINAAVFFILFVLVYRKNRFE